MKAWTKFSIWSWKINWILSSAVNLVSSNPCVGPKCTDELVWTLKIMIFLPTLLSGNKNFQCESSSVKGSHLGQILNLKKIGLGQLLSNK